MFRMAWHKWLLWTLALVLTAGCGVVRQVEKREQADKFIEASQDYVRRIRWRDWQGAAVYLLPAHQQPFIDTFTALKDLQIVELMLVDSRPDPVRSAAVAEYRLGYILWPSPTLREFTWKQNWEWIDGRWQSIDPFPPFPPPRP